MQVINGVGAKCRNDVGRRECGVFLCSGCKGEDVVERDEALNYRECNEHDFIVVGTGRKN